MRIKIALCLLAIFCTANAISLKSLQRQIETAKLDVENTIRELELFRNNIWQDVNLTVTKIWLEPKKEYDNYATSILNTIHKEVEDAKASGKNAQPCYNVAFYTFRITDYELRAEARLCLDTSTCSMKRNLKFIDNYITTGRELIKELDEILPGCYEKDSRLTDILKLHNCKSQLKMSKSSVKKLKTDANSAKATFKNEKNIVVDKYTTCLHNAFSTAHSKVENARLAATWCLNKL
ncbi:uncharacterized protein LOC105828267 [Monomorium pharaonis]|uniref:uncharacterized protein LOC105828267 n=1 Tax=Monomorium pharaonis TaxID=307658 RepID=UPI00063FAD53|nr:uncharacterized protein LOC105828267 [Monomorium pharaonis]